MRKVSLLVGLLCFCWYTVVAQVRYHQQDSVQVVTLLNRVDKNASSSEKLVWFGRSLQGLPYVEGTLEADTEVLTANLRQLDCVTFVETSLALTLASEWGGRWDDYLCALRRLRYRQGRVDGYASRLHYFTEWIYENEHTQGFVQEVTSRYATGKKPAMQPFFFMSTHVNAYPALQTDTVQLQAIRRVEEKLSRMPLVQLSKEQSDWQQQVDRLETGSIVAFTTRIAGLDVTHVGIVVCCRGKACLLHASSRHEKVLIEPGTLSDYIRQQKGCTGIRVLRLAFP